MKPIEWHDVQRLVLSGYPCLPYSAYVLWRFQAADRALNKQWLADIVKRLAATKVDDVDDDPSKPAINLALTHSGLRNLGVPEPELNSFSLEFIEGMAPLPVNTQIPRRTNVLGDLEESSPEYWDWGGWSKRRDIDGVLLLYAADETSLQKLIDTEREAMLRIADGDLIVLKGRFLPEMKEHFGYVDGLSQPKIEGRPERNKDKSADKSNPHRIKPGSEVKPGEFVLGYPNERGARVTNGHGRDIRRNGTYLVFRQLQQEVDAFNAFLSEVAKRTGENKEWVAARLLGRWRNGDPLVTESNTQPADAARPDAEVEAAHADAEGPDAPAAEPCERNTASKNDFLYYYKDRSGLMCPIGAHIRRANPRDSLGPDPETALRLSKMHRIIRRGRPYGEKWEPGAEKPDGEKAERGMLFIALNADIAGQFEMIQHSWLNNPRFNGLYSGTDPISHYTPEGLGITIQNRPANIHLDRPKPFVRVRGGAYFFLPGIQALNDIARA
jgi:Dyp-type peroxidase family